MEKISAVYKIVNEVTGDFYVGSSKNVYSRWANHKCPSRWKGNPNNLMYQDMKKYGIDKFRFQILCPVMPECLNQVEQELIEMLNPTYNSKNAKGYNVEKRREGRKKRMNKYRQTEKGKEAHRKINKKYNSQLCFYNGKTLTLKALANRFRKAGVSQAFIEAKKYLIK